MSNNDYLRLVECHLVILDQMHESIDSHKYNELTIYNNYVYTNKYAYFAAVTDPVAVLVKVKLLITSFIWRCCAHIK